MKIMITGGNGFIGTWLCKYLADKGHKIMILDDLSNSTRSNLIRLAYGEQNIKAKVGSILDKNLVNKILKEYKNIMHLAAIPRISNSIKYPTKTCRVNIEGTVNLLEQARKNNIEKFIYISSSSVYGEKIAINHAGVDYTVEKGDPSLNKFDELNPCSPYGIQKFASEKMCRFYYDKYKMNITILRYFNVFGSGQDHKTGAVVPCLIKAISDNEIPNITGDGKQIRSFTYIKDVIEATRLALLDCKGYEIYNVAGKDSIDINELYHYICLRLNKYPDTINYAERNSSDRLCSIANIDRINKRLGFSPKYSCWDGLKEMIK